ncbi:hypothetical protein [Xylanimonas ulmi]|uniref:hypothetical protein n=1 Tax=Xylanimonas ulmi TaxID=228973 RepID=UPI00102B6DB8|nr:hypothetical protein [Xylanibacterium ulmi]
MTALFRRRVTAPAHEEWNAMTHTGGPQVLLAGSADDLPQIRQVLDHAVHCVYGQIYLEVGAGEAASARALLPSVLPEGMSLTLLERRPRADGANPGEPLARALTAWADEWATEDALDAGQIIAMWVGYSGNPAVDAACDDLAMRLDRTPVHLHRD